MSPKERKKSFIDELFGGSLFDEIDKAFDRFEKEAMSGGYSINVTQTPQGTKVYARVGKDIDVNELRRRLEQEYPGAKIEIEGGRTLIREISTKSVEEDERDEIGT